MSVLFGLYVAVTLALLALALATLAMMLYAWRDHTSLDETRALDPGFPVSERKLSFSLLVPARHEQAVLGFTLDRIAQITHRDFEVIVVVGHDDPETRRVAQEAVSRHPDLMRVIVDHHPVKNKPRALNTALPHCRGDVVGVFDAEDIVHADVLTAVERRMVVDGSAALQAGVQLMNFWSSWFSVRNVLEYYFWFRSRLQFQSARGFIPLGGNTVFVRREVLCLLGGWDGDCLAEDCDLGVRLSAHGFRISVMYEPALVTQEETPASLEVFLRQRTRWNQGFLQVLFKQVWRLLPHRRQRALALYTLSTPFMQAISGVLVPFAVVTALVGGFPTLVALASFLPLLPALLTVGVEHIALHEFGRTFGRRPAPRDHVRLFLGTFPFQLLLSAAAIRAVIRHLRRDHSWEKTSHLGVHMEDHLQEVAA